MRTQFVFLLILILSSLICCNSIAQATLSDKEELVTVPNQNKSDSKELTELFNAFLNKQAQINIIKYNVIRIDTLLNGNIWNNTGKVLLERDKKDSILNISFISKMDSMDFENIYFQNTNYMVFTSKFYMKEPNFKNHIFGSPGGQLVITDLLNIDTTNVRYSLSDADDKHFKFKSDQYLNSSIITKVLIIDKQTLIPIQLSRIEKNKEHNWKRSISFIIDDVMINNQIGNNEHVNIAFLSKYGHGEHPTDTLANKLVGKKIPEIIFQTLDNKTINIRSLESKIVLLDFWELWCVPCKKSLPMIDKIASTYEPFGLFTIGITSGDIEETKKYIENNGIEIIQIMGNTKLKSTLKVDSFPRYILINREGIITGIYFGYSENIELDINNLLLK
ncbi:MAG: TlpA family protein disulfide reductase [Lentimicrobiaceae bacterium]|nr:TlpA family protein disulfide reductase [Lentimicrobiaceae bacterium]